MTYFLENLISPIVRAFSYVEEQMKLGIDVCDVQMGCVLLLEQSDKRTKPVGYWSRSLTSTELVYHTTQGACFAIVCEVLLLRPVPENTEFTI